MKHPQFDGITTSVSSKRQHYSYVVNHRIYCRLYATRNKDYNLLVKYLGMSHHSTHMECMHHSHLKKLHGSLSPNPVLLTNEHLAIQEFLDGDDETKLGV